MLPPPICLLGKMLEIDPLLLNLSSNTATKTTQIAHSLVRPVHVAAPKLTALDKGKGREITLGQDLAGLVGAESRAKGDSWGQAPLQSMSKKERKAVRRLSSARCLLLQLCLLLNR